MKANLHTQKLKKVGSLYWKKCTFFHFPLNQLSNCILVITLIITCTMLRTRLVSVIQTQAERNVHPATQKQYLSKLRVITSMLNETPDIRIAWKCLETIDGVACRHTGAAKDIFDLKLPITKNIGELLFAYISKRSSCQGASWTDQRGRDCSY